MVSVKAYRRNAALSLIFSLILGPLLAFVPAEPARAESTAGSVPSLLITELAPLALDEKGQNIYQYTEVYNNSDRPVSLKDYKLNYRYPAGPQKDIIAAPVPDNVSIQPGKTIVFWRNTAGKTVADFNAHFGTNLVDGKDIVRVSFGMHDWALRSIVVTTNTGYDIAVATYNHGSLDTANDKGTLFKYPEDGSNNMVLISGGLEPATPGTVKPGQVPAQLNHIDDMVPPSITNMTGKTESPTTQNLEIVANTQDAYLVKSFSLFYKTDGQNSYKEAKLRVNPTDSLYHYTIDFAELLGKKVFDYYFTSNDGTNVATSSVNRINLIQDTTSPRLNVKDNDILSNESVLKATATTASLTDLQLSVDGLQASGTYPDFENDAYMVFEGFDLNSGFQNAVTKGTEIIKLLNYGVTGYNTVAVPIATSKLSVGTNVFSLWAGSSTKTFETNPTVNLDDYLVRNVRLILSDGTAIKDSKYSNPTQTVALGDSGTAKQTVDFTFNIPPDKQAALAYKWNTASVADGPHTIQVTTPEKSVASARVLVDNNGPEISMTLEEGHIYKGPFVIDAAATDSVSGIQSFNVTLDGNAVTLPLATSSADLAPGDHVLNLTAFDNAKHKSEKTVRFGVVEEAPSKPVLESPQDGALDVQGDPLLRVLVSDPTNDSMNVTFYKGFTYTPTDKQHVTASRNASDVEPPKALFPLGEEALSEVEIANLAASDGQYVTVESDTKFPYIRFDVKLDGEIGAKDSAELNWVGNSLPGRKVTMYAWNYMQNNWTALDSFVPQSEHNFTLKGKATAGDFVRDNSVHVMVQDEVQAPGDYDYTFVWNSDPQYYSETYTNIYDTQVNWIKDHIDDMKIKYAINTGDLVNETNQEYQWETASRAQAVLDGSVPNGVLAGNHDTFMNNYDYSMYYNYFGEDRYKDKPYYGGSYKDNRGHYDLISAGGHDYIFVYMGWGINDEDMAWMNQVLAANPDRTAVICVHEFVLPNGYRSAAGNVIFDKVVKTNKNVALVLSGHYTGSALVTDAIDDNGDGTPDRNVYQMLNDYQENSSGGGGYMKLLHFNAAAGTIHVQTYSPYLDDYNFYEPDKYPGKDDWTLNLDLKPMAKRVATDSFQVKLFSDETIGRADNVASGQSAAVVWKDTQENQKYFWFTVAEDTYGGRTASDMWSFTTANRVPAPENVQVAGVTDTTVRLTWIPVDDPDAARITYDVYQQGSRGATVTDAVYQSAGLAPDTEYTFQIVAMDEKGNNSKPSAPITIRTQVNLSVVQGLVDGYIASGDLKGPLAVQLSNTLAQTEHQYTLGNKAQAIKHLQDFLKHLTSEPLNDRISSTAKATLNEKATALLAIWQSP
jgi:hypothetical protein